MSAEILQLVRKLPASEAARILEGLGLKLEDPELREFVEVRITALLSAHAKTDRQQAGAIFRDLILAQVEVAAFEVAEIKRMRAEYKTLKDENTALKELLATLAKEREARRDDARNKLGLALVPREN